MSMIDLSGGRVPMAIPYMPAGAHVICATINGEPGRRRVVVDEGACERLQADLEGLLEEARAGLRARPVVFFDHKQGAAAAFPRRFRWEPGRGVVLDLAGWSAAGRAAVEGGNYNYVSPAFRLSRKDGQVTGLVGGVEVASLVNDPAFERIDPILDVAAARAAEGPDGEDVVGMTIEAAHCNQHGHVPGCSKGGGEIVINFQPEYKTKREWLEAAREYFMEHYAGRTFSIGNTGHTLHVGSSEKRARLATKGVDIPRRYAAFSRLEDVIARAHHLGSEEAKAKPGQGHHKADIVAHTATFEKYGCTANINGARHLVWFNAQTKQKGAKDVLLYEFGLSEISEDIKSSLPSLLRQAQMESKAAQGAAEWTRAEEDNLPQLLTTAFTSLGSEGIVKGGLADVKQNNEVLELLAVLAEKAGAQISTGEVVASGGGVVHNGGNRVNGVLFMTEETKKKLGLGADADEVATASAVADLLRQRDSYKEAAEAAKAECEKLTEALKAARAEQKEAWLAELKKRGVFAPQDEEALKAASALYDANAAAARVAYAKMPGANDAPIVQASQSRELAAGVVAGSLEELLMNEK